MNESYSQVPPEGTYGDFARLDRIDDAQTGHVLPVMVHHLADDLINSGDEVLAQPEGRLVRDDVAVSQVEGVVHQTSPGRRRDHRVVVHQLTGQQFPVVGVVIDPIEAARIEVDEEPVT